MKCSSVVLHQGATTVVNSHNYLQMSIIGDDFQTCLCVSQSSRAWQHKKRTRVKMVHNDMQFNQSQKPTSTGQTTEDTHVYVV